MRDEQLLLRHFPVILLLTVHLLLLLGQSVVAAVLFFVILAVFDQVAVFAVAVDADALRGVGLLLDDLLSAAVLLFAQVLIDDIFLPLGLRCLGSVCCCSR